MLRQSANDFEVFHILHPGLWGQIDLYMYFKSNEFCTFTSESKSLLEMVKLLRETTALILYILIRICGRVRGWKWNRLNFSRPNHSAFLILHCSTESIHHVQPQECTKYETLNFAFCSGFTHYYIPEFVIVAHFESNYCMVPTIVTKVCFEHL